MGMGVATMPVTKMNRYTKSACRCTFVWEIIVRMDIIIIIDRFYIVLFSALEQTHCARM